MENILVKKERIKSIEKALDILELLSANKQEIGVTEISNELHLGLSTVYRILTTLKLQGYIIQNYQTSKYRIGIKLFELGCTAQSSINLNLIEIAMPYLKKLSKNTNETINLAILEGKEVIYISKIESPEILTTNIKIGTRLPAHCTALGKVLLAFLSNQEFIKLYNNDKEKLPSLTPNSISSVEELKKHLKKIRIQRYAIDREEYKIGINCLGVPIMKNGNKAIGAISITGPASRFTLDEMEKLKNKLISISKEVSNQLGYYK